MWIGVDVGDVGKGFHYAIMGAPSRICELGVERDPEALARRLEPLRPRCVAVDSPISPAPDGERSRWGERLLANRTSGVCGIRWTPDLARMEARRDYYGWVLNGLALHEALHRRGITAIECFPTATWTRLADARGRRSRARWTTGALATLGLEGVDGARNQDFRDAVAAAVTAWLNDRGMTEAFGEIAVPALDATLE